MTDKGPKRINPVKLSYPVEIYGGEKTLTLPFVIGVIANLSGDEALHYTFLEERKFLEFDKDNLDDRLKAIKPGVKVPMSESATDGMENFVIQFESMDGFSPLGIVNSTPHLSRVMSKRTLLADLRDKLETKPQLLPMLQPYLEQALQLNEEKVDLSAVSIAQLDAKEAPSLSIDVQEWKPGLLEMIALAADAAHKVLCELVSQVACHDLPGSFSLPVEVTRWVDEIDLWLERQVNRVLHHESFLKLESSWRGLDQLCQRLATSEILKIRVLNVSVEEMLKDLEVTALTLTSKIAETEYHQFGGQPYNLLLADFYFDQTPKSLNLLEVLSKVATVSASPLVGGASPALFQLADFRELHEPRRFGFGHLFKLREYQRWNAFCDMSEARNVALVLPRIVGRELFADAGADPRSFRFTENEVDHDRKPWINPAYAVAEAAANRHLEYGWIAARNNEPHDMIGLYSTSDFIDGDGQLTVTCPVETCLSDALVDQMVCLNLMCLQRNTGRDSLKIVNWDSLLSSDARSIPNTGQISRFDVSLSINYFCHYLASILRDRTGGFDSYEAGSKMLTDWSQSYVASDEMSQELQPLKALRIELLPARQLVGSSKDWLIPRLWGYNPEGFRGIGIAHIQPLWLTDDVDSPIACYFYTHIYFET